MSANVWFEEVNMGLIQEIKNTVRIRNTRGVLESLEDRAILIRKPEEDFKPEIFPCVSIYNVSYKHDPKRYNDSRVKVGEDIDKNVVIMEDQAVPFNLAYQLDFWAKFQEDMDYMTKSWLTKHFRQFNLNVVDDGGVLRTCNCIMKGSVTKSDLVLEGERLFHSIIKLLIWVELDDETRYNMPMVIKRNIDTKELPKI